MLRPAHLEPACADTQKFNKPSNFRPPAVHPMPMSGVIGDDGYAYVGTMTVGAYGGRPKAAVIAADQDATLNAITEIFRRLEAALAAKDAVAFDSVFTDDVVFINPAGSVFQTFDEVHAYHLTAMRNSPDAAARYKILALRLLAGGHAIVNVEQTLRTPAFSVTNRGTWVFTRRDDNWWVCSVHNTNVAGSAG